MRIAATALVGLLAATVSGAAAEPLAPSAGAPPPAPQQTVTRPAPPPSAAPPGENGRNRELHAALPEHGQRRAERPPRGRTCFNQAETREKIFTFHLSDPLRALNLGRMQGEALSAKLCRWSADQFVYEIHVLRGDGRVLRVYMNAQNGEAVGDPNGPARDRDRK